MNKLVPYDDYEFDFNEYIHSFPIEDYEDINERPIVVWETKSGKWIKRYNRKDAELYRPILVVQNAYLLDYHMDNRNDERFTFANKLRRLRDHFVNIQSGLWPRDEEQLKDLSKLFKWKNNKLKGLTLHKEHKRYYIKMDNGCVLGYRYGYEKLYQAKAAGNAFIDASGLDFSNENLSIGDELKPLFQSNSAYRTFFEYNKLKNPELRKLRKELKLNDVYEEEP